MLTRRGIIGVLAGLVAAPMVVRPESLMPVRAMPTHLLTLDGFAEQILGPQVDGLAERVAAQVMGGAGGWEVGPGDNYLTIQQITREAVRLFSNSNKFIEHFDREREYDAAFYAVPVARGELLADLVGSVPPVAAVALGAAAVLNQNPALSRRSLFFGGVREGGSVASPDPSSSDPPRRIPTNQETVA